MQTERKSGLSKFLVLWEGTDRVILLLTGALITIGIVLIFATSVGIHPDSSSNGLYYVSRHFIHLFIAVLIIGCIPLISIL